MECVHTWRGRVQVLMATSVLVLILVYVKTPWKPLWKIDVRPLRWNSGTTTTTTTNISTTVTEEERELDELLQILKTKLDSYRGPRYNYTRQRCGKDDAAHRTCYDAGCPGQFSPSLRDRLKQVLTSRTPIPARYLHALTSAAQPLTPHKYIFVTAASSNHFYEMQAFMHSIHESLFPRMKGENFTLVFYNLGLTEQEKLLTEKNCRCTVLDFPFSGLPDFIGDLKCYAWKTLIIASLLDKAEYLIWLDASVRLRNSDPFPEMFQRAREYGYQAQTNTGSIAVRTRETMAQFFGDRYLCQYSPFSEMEATFMVFYNDRFVREAIIEPWRSCAFSRDCMCIQDHARFIDCSGKPRKRVYGLCHRFDQSGIGMIVSKLYLENRPMLYVPRNGIKVARETKMDWFKQR